MSGRPSHLTKRQQEEVSEEYLMSEEFQVMLDRSRAAAVFKRLKSAPESVDGPRGVIEALEVLESYKLVEHTQKEWKITELGVKVVEKMEERRPARSRKKLRRKEVRARSREASFIAYCVIVASIWFIFEVFKFLGAELNQYFGGLLGTVISIVIWIPGLLVIILVVIFFSWLFAKLGFKGFYLFQ